MEAEAEAKVEEEISEKFGLLKLELSDGDTTAAELLGGAMLLALPLSSGSSGQSERHTQASSALSASSSQKVVAAQHPV